MVLAAAADIADRTVVLTAPQGSDTPFEQWDGTWGTSELRISAPPRAVDTLDALTAIADECRALVYMRGDEPFIQVDLARRMIDQHITYAAHYTFSDGYPSGMSPEIMSPGLPSLLRGLAEQNEETPGSGAPDREIAPGWIFEVLQKDINSFDVETLLAPRDMRMLRIELRCDTRVNFLLCRRVAASGVRGHEQLTIWLDEQRHILRTMPAFIGIQVTDGCPQVCSYCPFPEIGGDILNSRGAMPVDRFAQLVTSIEEMSPEAVIGLGPWGEPLLHPELDKLLQRIVSTRKLSAVVETSGLGVPVERLLELVRRFSPRVSWILSLDANEAELYRSLRGEGFEQAQQAAHTLVAEAPAATWIQAVRMQENEAHLEQFYRYWKEKTGHVIVQKYDWFSGRLPQRKVTDLSPLTRLPCWQNKRELYVRMDGTVPRCREDLYNEYSLGNAFTEPLPEIWERGEAVHSDHVAGTFREICENCDEYYVFNF
ncbi:MAG: spiro-SPASM protein [bacterium]